MRELSGPFGLVEPTGREVQHDLEGMADELEGRVPPPSGGGHVSIEDGGRFPELAERDIGTQLVRRGVQLMPGIGAGRGELFELGRQGEQPPRIVSGDHGCLQRSADRVCVIDLASRRQSGLHRLECVVRSPGVGVRTGQR